MSKASIRIGGASGFWGDSSVGAPQLVQHGDIDYLVFDYLAELTMSILAAAHAKNPELGYATDFVSVTMKQVLQDVVAKNIRVISNAGGVNPQACADALGALAAEQGLSVKIAVVLGDDVTPLLPVLRDEGVTELQSGAPMPAKILTANAYLGALPIKAALDAGARIVITGRCVDSAVTLGALMHEFNWSPTDFDKLAQGSLAGHIIECGCQATGGLHTDWESVPDWAHIGYPVVECEANGRFTVTKPPATGGLVSPATVGEQMLYEIGDPARYLLPDVVCDFTQVTMTQTGEHRVLVQGARGTPPGPAYKVSATWMDGFRCTGQLTIVGLDAARKAQRTAEAILSRTRELLAAAGLPDYTRTAIEVLGSEAANFGPHAQTAGVREVVLHLAVMHPVKAALELFAREIAPAGTSWSPGTTGGAGRPSPAPCIRQFAFLIDKTRLQPVVAMGDTAWPVVPVVTPSPACADRPGLPVAGLGVGEAEGSSASTGSARTERVATPTERVAARTEREATPTERVANRTERVANRTERVAARAETAEVPLIALAWARSGDKGNTSNIGVIARCPEWLPLLRDELTEARVAEWLAHRVRGTVTRYDVPGIHALNFVCTEALDGGGMASLRNDPLGKGMAQILLAMPVRVPQGLPGLCAG